MRHINALLNSDEENNLRIIFKDALMRATDNILSHPLTEDEILDVITKVDL